VGRAEGAAEVGGVDEAPAGADRSNGLACRRRVEQVLGAALQATFGSVAGLLGLYPRLYRATLERLADLPARILVTIGDDADPGELGPLPANVHVERWVAQDAVIPRADAVVCHGGYGSVLGALAHGVPVVALPLFADDQWRNARRLEDLGAGIALEGIRGHERRMLDGPDPQAFRALPEAIDVVLRDGQLSPRGTWPRPGDRRAGPGRRRGGALGSDRPWD
jgi:hypothetical protein